MFENNATLIQIIESWKNTDNCVNTTEEIIAWIDQKNKKQKVTVEKIPFSEDCSWYYNKEEKGIVNRNGAFFKITGIMKKSSDFYIEQPIIIQNEIGYLGIICKNIIGTLHFLMQAKIEPGNKNVIQISPTIQATKSNFMRSHGGAQPAYLEYFMNTYNSEVIIDQIQSEQSSRFYGKRNRNIIIKINDNIKVLPNHMWMTLGQIKELMKIDNLINMDVRSVLACIPISLRQFDYKETIYLQSLFKNKAFFNSMINEPSGSSVNQIYQYFNEYKMKDKSITQIIDLHELKDWSLVDNREYVKENGDFKVIYCDISIDQREVKTWKQPLLEACYTSIFGLICTVEDNKLKFLVQAISEVGCFDKIELGPSVQINSKLTVYNEVDKLFLRKWERNEDIVTSNLFSEEGGRFYHEENRNVILHIEKREIEIFPEGYFWVDFATLNMLIQINNCLNIQLRNLLSLMEL